MIKTEIFDTDGVVIHREMYFSQRFSKEFGVPMEKVLPFFQNEFQLCLAGKADLKIELVKYIEQWKWQKTVDDLLKFWFKNERSLDSHVLESVNILRKSGVECYLNTNNEKYRVAYLYDSLGLKNYFNATFSSAEIGFLKPQQEFWAYIYDQLGKPDKSEVLVWDDDEENVKSARVFGFQSELYVGFEAYTNRMNSFLLL